MTYNVTIEYESGKAPSGEELLDVLRTHFMHKLKTEGFEYKVKHLAVMMNDR